MKDSKQVALLTNTISRPGGAENVTLTMFKVLRSINNVRVNILGSETRLNLKEMLRWIPENLVKDIINNYRHVPRFPLNIFTFKNFDLVINTRSNEVLAPAHIHYVHWIFSPYGVKDTGSLTYYREAYGIHSFSMRAVLRHLLHLTQLKITRLVLANSKYTAKLLNELGINAKVLYPPVNVKDIINATSHIPKEQKNKLVITVSRIAPGKQLELIPMVAQKIPDVKFILVGSLYDKYYYEKLLKLRNRLNSTNFLIIPNLPRHKLYELLGKASIYLHTAHYEQFGIAVVEAMAAGCVPVVHRSGGPWHDILDEKDGIYGFSYKDQEGAVEAIENLISKSDLLKELSGNVKTRATIFDEDIFKLRFKKIIIDIIGDYD